MSRAPPDIATFIYHTDVDPFTGEEIYVAKHLRDRKLQRALLQFFKPENYFVVRQALQQAGRQDLIGNECDALIPSNPPKAALDAKRKQANASLGEGKYVHRIANQANGEPIGERGLPNQGYRPERKSARRQDK